MRMNSYAVRLATAGSALLIAAAGFGQDAKPAVVVKTVSYAEMGNVVKHLKGKVIVVDFWADT